MEKNLCKDLRDCSIYFPCAYFFTGIIESLQIQQCPADFVFDENKQECAQPTTREDFQCLLMSNRVANVAHSTTTSQPFSSHAQSTLSNELITIYEKSFGASSVSNKSLMKKINFPRDSKKQYSSLKIKKNVEDEYEDEYEEASETVDKKKVQEKNNEEIEDEEQESATVDDPNAPEYKRMCIVTDWSQFRKGKGQFKFEYINIHLCNHIIFSTVVVSESEEAEEDEEYIIKTVQHNDLNLFAQLASFKARKPELKLILRIGDENGRIFSKLSKNAEARSKFVTHTIDFIKEHNFDGVELDWKWPCGQSGSSNDKQNLPLLLKVTFV